MTICLPCQGKFEARGAHTVDTKTEERYDDDPPWLLRYKFTLIALFGNALTFPLMLVHRIVDVASLNFIKRGTEIAEHLFLIRLKTDSSLKERVVTYEEIKRESKKELLDSIKKIALLPLGFIAKEVISVFGLLFPFQGRKYFAKVDQFFYVRPLDMFELENSFLLFKNFTAPCMQTSEFRSQENLFRFYSDNRGIASYHLEFSKLIDYGQEFYPYDLSSLKDRSLIDTHDPDQAIRLIRAIASLKEVLSNYIANRWANETDDIQKIQNSLTKKS